MTVMMMILQLSQQFMDNESLKCWMTLDDDGYWFGSDAQLPVGGQIGCRLKIYGQPGL